METEAKLFIQKAILHNTFELVWSYILDYENAANPYHNRKQSIAMWKGIAMLDINASERVVICGKKFMEKGIKKKDALHVACAIEAKCDYLLSTDKKLLKAVFEEIIVINPIDFIKILGI